MRKTLLISLITATSLNLAACSSSQTSDVAQTTPQPPVFEAPVGVPVAQPPAPTAPAGQKTIEVARGPLKPERFTPGGAADDGVVVESRQIKRESLNGPSPSVVNHNISQGSGLVSTTRMRVGAPAGRKVPSYDGQPDQDDVKANPESMFTMATTQPLSTFSADVDTASYSNVRRELLYGRAPSADLVRVEEMINYFTYDLPNPDKGRPFSVTTELSDNPWSDDTKIMRVAIKTSELDRGDTPPRNLVFLLDVSGSMSSPDKLPLLKQSLRTFVDTLDDNDRVAIVVYAGASGLVLPSTTGDKKLTILDSIDRLQAGGSTNGASGIELAYAVAEEHRSENSVNRVILATDGDFNVGISSNEGLKQLIEEKRKSGLFLSVLGFGRGNDKLMETLADYGNGNYAAIDSLNEARKVLVKEAGATLVTVAKDVKFQVAFDPKQVESYRLIGYKNRRLAARDFNDDTKDAGELGAGHAVTALYELRLHPPTEAGLVDQILTQAGAQAKPALATVKLRYKAPDGDKSQLMEVPVSANFKPLKQTSPDHQWSLGVAGFGLRLEGELSTKQLSHESLEGLLQPKMSARPDEYEAEFYSLVKKSEGVSGAWLR